MMFFSEKCVDGRVEIAKGAYGQHSWTELVGDTYVKRPYWLQVVGHGVEICVFDHASKCGRSQSPWEVMGASILQWEIDE